MKPEKDWMGLWYKIIKERGENDEPTFGRIDLKTKQIEWTRFSHMDMDGVGVLNQIYTEKGIQLKSIPSLKEKKYPSFFEAVSIFIKLLFKEKKPKPDWIEKNLGLNPTNVHALSYFIFSPEELNSLEQFCKKNKINPCALLMNRSGHVLLNRLTINKEGTWTLPVNLRPILKKQNYNSNHSSGVLIPILKDDQPKDTFLKIKNSLANKEHWAIWWVHQIGRIIGYQGMKFLSNQNAKKSFLLGSFSYLSKWELPENDIFIGGAPGSKNFPISIMVMIANDHLSFSLKIHPYVLADQSKTGLILNDIKMDILTLIANS